DRDDDKRSTRDDDDKRSTFRSRDDDGDKRSSRDDDKRSSRDDDKRKDRDDDNRKSADKRKGSREDDDADKRKGSRDDDDKRKGSRDDDDRGKRSASRDDDDDNSVRDGDDDDDDGGGRRRKKRHHRGDDNHVRHPLTQAAAWADAGAGFARRTFTYNGGGMTPPPPVGTAAPAAQLEAELYPASFSTLKGPAAGIGIAGAFDRELALSIAVPGTTIVAPIKSGYYWFGARYRFSFGGNSIAVGASYWRRTYMADRSGLGMTPEKLDMPDVDYTAVAPDLTGRFAASPKLGVFASVQLPLMLNSGPIQDNKSYGPSKILAFDVRSGVQYAFGAHYALQVALAFDQVGFKFGAKQGTMAAAREVSAATDRSLGLAATLGIMY
ncbi:MAG TPA: hypothetical protein VL326_12785, partial [Kofleriaceae bacterium]|nr:hypothetical protein [Kofleriaceae bacterium]